MQGDVLGTEEIVASLDALGDGGGKRALACKMRWLDTLSGKSRTVLRSLQGCPTIARPRELGAKGWLLLIHLEPHGTIAIPGTDALPVRHAGQIELHGPWMVDVGAGTVGHRGTGCDIEDRRSRSRGRLEAPNLPRGDITDEPVALPVVGLPDLLPVGAASNLGESVMPTDAEGGGQEDEGGWQHDETE